jgi:hypothetical protein
VTTRATQGTDLDQLFTEPKKQATRSASNVVMNAIAARARAVHERAGRRPPARPDPKATQQKATQQGSPP